MSHKNSAKKTLAGIILTILPFFAVANKDTTLYFGINGRIAGLQDFRIKKEVDYLPCHKIKMITSEQKEGRIFLLYTENYKLINDSVFRIKVKGKNISEQVTRKFIRQTNGTWKFTDYSDGKVVRAGYTSSKIPLLIEGALTEFYKNGTKKSVSVFKSNELVSNENWLETGEKDIGNIFYSAEKEPIFPQGMGYLHQHILKTFKDSGLEISTFSGTILIGFVVMETGQIDGIRVVKGFGNQLDGLAVRAFESLLGKWKPAEIDNRPVRYFQVFPINFISGKTEFKNIEFSGGILSWDVN